MDREQMTYAITLQWLYNVINGEHEKAHDVICKMSGKSPDIIHDIFACTSIILSNFAGILKTQSKENRDYIAKFCADMISDNKPEEVFEQFMNEEDYNDPDDFILPESADVVLDDDIKEEIDKVKKNLDRIHGGWSPRASHRSANPHRRPQQPKQSKDEKKNPTKLKFIGVEFDYDKVNLGEKKVNDALGKGFEIIKTISTESGLVVVMGLYKSEGRK